MFFYCPSYSGRKCKHFFSPANIPRVALKHSRTLCFLVAQQTKLLYSRTWKGFQNSQFVCHDLQRCHNFHLGSGRMHSHEIAALAFAKKLSTSAWGRNMGTEVSNMEDSICHN